MSNNDVPKGELFSRVYLERGAPLRDSERFRARLGGYFQGILLDYRDDVANFVTRNLGVPTGTWFPKFFGTAELRDVLDTITLIWQYLMRTHHIPLADAWHGFVQQALHEENLGYRLDEECGVHPFVDEEFERNRVSALQCLAKYPAVADHFESAHQHLEDGRSLEAVRSVFDAVEVLANRMAGGKIASLGASDVERHLKKIAQAVYSDTARDAANQLLNGLADWINSIQPYRHGQEDPDPPLEIAIAMVSAGATYLRWLVEIDQARNTGAN